ncbi:MAG: uroporphyrinogen-III C-methyltransferase [Candidatus Sulfotelmatobacter sp.]|jgi:uroporphyrin-III C-methyltransferase
MKGKVYLVGAGPGDPELLTVKALRLLQNADAVLYDDLVAPEILSLAPQTAQMHDVGKRCGKKKIHQEEINFLMIALADSGLQVVRLKSGDPLVFGRAGEEMESLRRAGISYEVVPGVTSALGAAAVAGIPLTHRHKSSALILLTAHQASESDTANWSKLVGSGSTLVIYMPGQKYADLAAKLRAAGLADVTPCVVISRATTARQTTHRTTIGELHRAPKFVSPTLLVVGEVVRFADASLDEIVRTSSQTEFSLPAAFLADYPSRVISAGDEEPIA